jgi:hypothetical protein
LLTILLFELDYAYEAYKDASEMPGYAAMLKGYLKWTRALLLKSMELNQEATI